MAGESPAPEQIATRSALEPVVAILAMERIETSAPIEHVVPVAANERRDAGQGIHKTVVADHPIIAVAAHEPVVVLAQPVEDEQHRIGTLAMHGTTGRITKEQEHRFESLTLMIRCDRNVHNFLRGRSLETNETPEECRVVGTGKRRAILREHNGKRFKTPGHAINDDLCGPILLPDVVCA